MKLQFIFALFTLIFTVKGAWWTAAVQPVILSIGAVLSAIDLDILDVQPLEWTKLNIFKQARKKKEEKKLIVGGMEVTNEEVP